jgi:hypothetical protein
MLTTLCRLQGTCRVVDLKGVEGASRNGDWAEITIPLSGFTWWKSGWSFSDWSFTGCSGTIGGWDVNQIEFKVTHPFLLAIRKLLVQQDRLSASTCSLAWCCHMTHCACC